MAVGVVGNGYAGAVGIQAGIEVALEGCYDGTSGVVQQTEGENTSPVIGLTTLSYGDKGTNHRIYAQYAVDSTEEDPVIQITANHGEEFVSYRVHIKEVDPHHASELEMFALLSYADDQGMAKGSAGASYQQMKVYTDHAQSNGYWEGNETYDDFLRQEQDWSKIITYMWDDYAKAGLFSQVLNCQKIVSICEHFSIQQVDFDAISFEDRTEETFLHAAGIHVSEEVARAWFEAAAEAGVDDMDTDMLTHLSNRMIRRIMTWQRAGGVGEARDVSLETLLRAAREALADLEYPLTAEISSSPEVQEERTREKAFYQNYIEKLEQIQSTGEMAKNGTQATEDTSEIEVVPTHSMTYREMLANKINEILEKIQGGTTEPSFAIGASSFTLEEWELFLKTFDKIQEEIKKSAGQKLPPKDTSIKAEEEIEEIRETADYLTMLLFESTSCSYPASEEAQEEERYITYYTREYICCKKAGESGYEWKIALADETQYEQVMEFLHNFDDGENLRFTCHENFWQDFLNGSLNLDGFMEFMNTRVTDGVPNYVNVDGDRMWIDPEAAQYAKYMNQPGLFRIIARTTEEFFQWQEQLMAEKREQSNFLQEYYKKHPDEVGKRNHFYRGQWYTMTELYAIWQKELALLFAS